ncbi:hypothetical protein V6N13_073823 [Hibiscus sabdariffa]
MPKARPLSLQTVDLKVRMCCTGCERVVKNAIYKLGVLRMTPGRVIRIIHDRLTSHHLRKDEGSKDGGYLKSFSHSQDFMFEHCCYRI